MNEKLTEELQEEFVQLNKAVERLEEERKKVIHLPYVPYKPFAPPVPKP